MQLNGKGSMGIPEEMREEMHRQQQQKKAKQNRPEPDDGDVREVDSLHPDLDETPPKKEEEVKPEDIGALHIFKKLGIEMSEEDVQKLIFKGYVEKDIEIVKGLLTAKLKTLTTEEYDIIDEMIAEETKATEMTVDGHNGRKSVLTVAMSLVSLNGKPVVREVPKNEDGSVNIRKYTEMRRMVLRKMSATVVDKMIRIHGSFTVGVNIGVENPEDLLKNS